MRLPYNLSTFAEIAASAAFKDQAFVARVVKRVAEERMKWQQFLVQQGFEAYESQANFLFFKAPRSAELSDYLLSNGYLVRTGLGKDWLRISVGRPVDNQNVQSLIKAFYK